jgi:hypothetical protein
VAALCAALAVEQRADAPVAVGRAPIDKAAQQRQELAILGLEAKADALHPPLQLVAPDREVEMRRPFAIHQYSIS